MLMWSLVWVISSVDAVQAKKHEGSWGGSAGGGNGGQGTEREVTAVPFRHLGSVQTTGTGGTEAFGRAFLLSTAHPALVTSL